MIAAIVTNVFILVLAGSLIVRFGVPRVSAPGLRMDHGRSVRCCRC